jgi:hypothetical protein
MLPSPSQELMSLNHLSSNQMELMGPQDFLGTRSSSGLSVEAPYFQLRQDSSLRSSGASSRTSPAGGDAGSARSGFSS